jgi:hypothetical protein
MACWVIFLKNTIDLMAMTIWANPWMARCFLELANVRVYRTYQKKSQEKYYLYSDTHV